MVTHGDVVLVAVAYRLGPFGFLSSGGVRPSTNLGLWDQRLAFTWVKQNIRAFGGDPEKITILGHSAGAISVALHMVRYKVRMH